MASLINIGLSGITASNASLATISNNVANANTPGYSRQLTAQVSSGSIQYGNLTIGTGTTLSDVRRVYDSYLTAQVQTSTSLNNDASTYQAQIKPVDALLSDKSTGISSTLQAFFTSLQGASSDPTNDSTRQQVLSSASALSNSFNSIYSQLTQQSATINSTVSDTVTQVNQLASSIALYNRQISNVASSTSSGPNDLLDKRDEALRQLSTLVGIQVEKSGSSYNVNIGSGQPLVLGNTSNTLEVATSSKDPSQPALLLDGGSSKIDVTSVVSGGNIGGLLRYRSDVLTPTLNALGRLALVTGDQVNSQLAQGVDKNGELGSSLFNDINSASLVSQRSIAQVGNGSGNLNVAISDTGKLTDSDYQVTFSSSTDYSVKRLSDGVVTAGSLDPASGIFGAGVDGVSLSLNGGVLSAGDTFKVTPTRSGAGDIQTVMTDAKTLALAAPLTGTAGAGNKGTGAFGSPVVTSTTDIHDPTAKAEVQSGLQNSTPVKLVFDAAAAGTQSYTLYDALGSNIGTGNIIPGQSNTLNLQVKLVDAGGAAINDPTGAQRTLDFQVSVSGTLSANDSYSVALTGANSADNRNALATIGLQTRQTIETGSASSGVSLTNGYAKLVTSVGSKASQAINDSNSTSAILTTATTAQSSLSGVNLNEESANLIKFQQYYTASTQIIKAAQTIFSTLINSL